MSSADPRAPSPSYDDESDNSESDYTTIKHGKATKGMKLLFAKSMVYAHPTPSAKDNVAGHVAVLQQPQSSTPPALASAQPHSPVKSARSSHLLLAWLPDSSLGDAQSTYAQLDLFESDQPPKHAPNVSPPATITSHSNTIVPGFAFAIPVTDIYSLVVRPPNAGWWHGSIVINPRAGDALPPLFFHDSESQSTLNQSKKQIKERLDPFGENDKPFWAGDKVLGWLKRYAVVERSPESSVYLINPSEEDMKGYGRPTPEKITQALSPDTSSSSSSKTTKQKDPLAKALRDARWNFLEKLSQVTTFTRRTAQAVAENDKLPIQVCRILQNPHVQTVQDEFDSARIYLARWAMSIAEQSERDRSKSALTARNIIDIEDSELGDFEILNIQTQNLSFADKRSAVTKSEWDGFFDSRGRLHVTPDEVRERVFHGGLSMESGVRADAWLFLLGVYEWNSTKDDRCALLNSLHDEYARLKGKWWDRLVDASSTLEHREWWKEQKMRIEKDVHRTDRHLPLFAGEDIPHPDPDSPFAEVGTNVHLEQMKDMLLTYNEYNPTLGYVQGMSDLLAPIYVIMQDDAVAFWAFVSFMDRMEHNFLRDQSGMRVQLQTLDHLVQLLDPKLYLHLQAVDSTNFFFFFRMLLVWYKREFEFEDICCLWERLWADYLTSSFHIFFAVAILEKHRTVIMDHLKGFDEVLKYVNELSNTIDLESTLVRAEALFLLFQRTVEAVDKKDNFPVPSSVSSAVQKDPAPSTSPKPSQSKKHTQPQTAPSSFQTTARAVDKVITPELRALLKRDFEVVNKSTI